MNFTKSILIALASFVALPAYSATVSLVPSTTTVSEGGSFTVDLVLDAADAPGNHPGSFRGLIELDYGSSADYTGFTYTSPAVAFGATTDNPGVIELGFDLANDVGVIGTFSFDVTGSAGDVIDLDLEDAVFVIGSFFNTDPSPTKFTPTFVDAQVSVVPVPAAIWLLGSALVGLGSMRRRKPLGNT